MAAEYIGQRDFQDTDSLNKCCICKVYLVTYSQVDSKSVAIEKGFQKWCWKYLIPEKRILCSLSNEQYQKNLIRNQGFTIICV